MSDFELACRIVKDDPAKPSIAVADGTMETPDGAMLAREKWFFISRAQILACEPPFEALAPDGRGGYRDVVTLTIPEWLAKDRGLV
jgi:hypothetical protein